MLRSIWMALAGLMAWAEPFDYEDDDDPLLSSTGPGAPAAYFW